MIDGAGCGLRPRGGPPPAPPPAPPRSFLAERGRIRVRYSQYPAAPARPSPGSSPRHPLPQAGEGINFSRGRAAVSLRPRGAPPPTPPRANYARKGENSTAHRGLGTSPSPLPCRFAARCEPGCAPRANPSGAPSSPCSLSPLPLAGEGAALRPRVRAPAPRTAPSDAHGTCPRHPLHHPRTTWRGACETSADYLSSALQSRSPHP
jgi:hypothetical protein